MAGPMGDDQASSSLETPGILEKSEAVQRIYQEMRRTQAFNFGNAQLTDVRTDRARIRYRIVAAPGFVCL